MTDYVQQLAAKLDSEWVSDEDRTKALASVRECLATGRNPVEAFGQPVEYAKTFPQDEEKRRQYQRPMNVGGVLAGAWFIGGIVYVKKSGSHLPVDVVLLGGPMVIINLSIAAAFGMSRLRVRRYLHGLP